ncbi:transferrin 2 isoform X3 [Cylas formicarius]|uniref:transferrin 2 isoform X3 n=1 Tax=Cylas formicarius TaxID=197179 RepID=UPI0029584420|nr:transferrin 2 isoform X3 [Cylas formicarius]
MIFIFRTYSYQITLLCLTSLSLDFVLSGLGQNVWKTNQVEKSKPSKEQNIIWCTISVNETNKCTSLSKAVERDQIKLGRDTVKISCLQATNKDECMALLDEEKATMTTLDAGQVFVGGRYHSLVPIAQEIMEGGFNYYYAVAVVKLNSLPDVFSLGDLKNKRACFAGVETFAGWMLPISTLMKEGFMKIIDCNNHVKSATNFFGSSCAVNCLSDKYNPIGDNSDKLCQLCIGPIPGRRCTDADPYAGYNGAFRCLLEAGEIAFVKHNTVPELLAKSEYSTVPPDTFELFCKDGSRRPISDYLSCHWGRVPSDAIMVSSAVSFEQRELYQRFLKKLADTFAQNGTKPAFDGQPEFGNRIRPGQNFDEYGNRGNQGEYDQYGNRVHRFKRQDYGRDRFGDDRYGNANPYDQDNYRQENQDRVGQNSQFDQQSNRFGQNIPYDQNQYGQDFNREDQNNVYYYEYFDLFESVPRYGDHGNLMFQDSARGIAAIPETMQTYTAFLGESHDVIMGVRECPVNRMTLCVTSDEEKNKCVKMRTALKAQLLKPEMDCYKGHSQINCMQAIRAGTADVAVLDASDVYTAGLNFDLVPFISEVYNLEDPDYYVVAVAKESDPDTELTYLRTKNTCHGGISMAAGWVYPLAFLISNGWIRPYGCNSVRAAAEYFTKSCVPGAISTEYNTGVPYDNMCDLCHGSSYRYCRRDASEDYYGHTGAFRCLVEGGGDVAFVKHTTVFENTGGKKREWWARDNLLEDFELLCPDGTRAEINEYRKCNLGRVKANAVVTRGGYGYNETQINAYVNLFLYAQTFYGRKTTDEFSFSMFTSPPPYSDLIFQDATTQLEVIDPSKRYYSTYLGKDFMRARRIVDCHAGVDPAHPVSLAVAVTIALALARTV